MSAIQQTTSQLRSLRLVAMADAYQLQMEQPKLQSTSFDDRFGLLVEA